MKVLVTGGAGLIGRWAVDELIRKDHEVVSVVRRPSVKSDELQPPTSEVLGDAADGTLMHKLMQNGVDSVLHLAAIPSPQGKTAVELLVANSILTMTVLEAAGQSGVKSVVQASSISALGMAWSETFMSPLYLPIDEEHPLRPTEGYALSKENDEAAARMAARRWGMNVLSLRFPFTTTSSAIEERAQNAVKDSEQARRAAKECWAYLDVRDAGRACELALVAASSGRFFGAAVLNIIADDVLVDEPLQQLLTKWHPQIAQHISENAEGGAYHVAQALLTIGFRAKHLRRHAV
jgi:nucleoside-diphosphate-sugar epimerase